MRGQSRYADTSVASAVRASGNAKSLCPLELRTGIVGGSATPVLARQVCFLMGHWTTSRAADFSRAEFERSHGREAVLKSGVTLTLTADQALVLFDWLAREDGKAALPTEHQAEQNVLWEIEAQLEKSLVAPLQPVLLAAPRERLVAGSE